MRLLSNPVRALVALALLFAGVWVAIPAVAAPDYADRSEIEDRYKWDLEDIYESNEAWEKDFERLDAMLPTMAAFEGKLSSGTMLLGALDFRDRMNNLYEHLLVFASMRHDEDTRVEAYTAMRDRVQSLGVKRDEALSWLEPEILAMGQESVMAIAGDTPGLELYNHHLDNMFRSAVHTLDADGEKLMALSGDVTGSFYDVFGSFHNADVSYGTVTNEEGEEVELTKGLYRVFQESKDRRLREESWKAFYTAYSEYGRTLASNMSGNVKSHVFNAKARGYESSLEASLDRNAIPTDVYRNLISTVRDNLEPLHRYVALRKRLLGVEQLEVWDMAAPLVEQTSKDIPFDDGVEIVADGLSMLGDEYMTPFREGLNSGWVDVYETPGKRSGAYSWGAYGTKPYLLLNYRGTLDNVFTLAHEMGHSMQTYLSSANQPYLYADYSIFVAEVASTANEALLIERMLADTTDPDERKFLLNHYLEQIRGTFFTQVMFADIELQMHERVEAGEPLTKSALNKIYNETYRAYSGPALNVAELNGAAWSRIPHFYYNFYMFQYATSYAAATAIAKGIMEEGQPAVDRLMTFLKAGSSDYPIEVLKTAGVDMTKPEPILDTIAVFESLLDRLEDELAMN